MSVESTQGSWPVGCIEPHGKATNIWGGIRYTTTLHYIAVLGCCLEVGDSRLLVIYTKFHVLVTVSKETQIPLAFLIWRYGHLKNCQTFSDHTTFQIGKIYNVNGNVASKYNFKWDWLHPTRRSTLKVTMKAYNTFILKFYLFLHIK